MQRAYGIGGNDADDQLDPPRRRGDSKIKIHILSPKYEDPP